MPESSQGLFSLGPTELSAGTLRQGLLLNVRNWAVRLPELRALATSPRVVAPMAWFLSYVVPRPGRPNTPRQKISVEPKQTQLALQ